MAVGAMLNAVVVCFVVDGSVPPTSDGFQNRIGHTRLPCTPAEIVGMALPHECVYSHRRSI